MTSPRICFGHKTALQLLRTIDASELSWAKSSVLPDRPPTRGELNAAIELLEASYPELKIKRPVHIVLGSGSRCRTSKDCIPHTCLSDLSNKSLYCINNNLYISNPVLAFIQTATQERSLISLLELGYELCGSYQSLRTSAPSAYQVNPLTSVRTLRSYTSRNASLDGARKVMRAVPYLADDSASPRETKQALVLGLPTIYGGYGLGIPQMNFEIKASESARAITRKTSFRSDLCWPAAKLDVEYQSREMHAGEIKRIQDSRRANALASMGWTVIGVTNEELDSLVATDTIAATISRHLGKRMRIRTKNYHARKLKLRWQLGLPTGHE